MESSISGGLKQIFILSGQSNMSGRGGVYDHLQHWDGIVPPECFPDPSRIFRLNSRLNWEVARVPLHSDIDIRETCGVGPGMPFANAVKDHLPGALGLVPCAIGGTAIKEWARGAELYQNMVKRAKAAVAGGGGELKALLWYQGESDTFFEYRVEVYKENLEALIRNVREDLDSPSLPVILVAIASGDERYLERIREIQKGIKMANVVCVDAKGLELEEDHLHLTAAAQVQLGRMLAEAYLAKFRTGLARYSHLFPPIKHCFRCSNCC